MERLCSGGIYPTVLPSPPTPKELKISDDPEQKFSAWEDECRSVMLSNRNAVEAAVIAVKVCAVVHTLIGQPNHHFSWCPYEAWVGENYGIDINMDSIERQRPS